MDNTESVTSHTLPIKPKNKGRHQYWTFHVTDHQNSDIEDLLTKEPRCDDRDRLGQDILIKRITFAVFKEGTGEMAVKCSHPGLPRKFFETYRWIRQTSIAAWDFREGETKTLSSFFEEKNEWRVLFNEIPLVETKKPQTENMAFGLQFLRKEFLVWYWRLIGDDIPFSKLLPLFGMIIKQSVCKNCFQIISEAKAHHCQEAQVDHDAETERGVWESKEIGYDGAIRQPECLKIRDSPIGPTNTHISILPQTADQIEPKIVFPEQQFGQPPANDENKITSLIISNADQQTPKKGPNYDLENLSVPCSNSDIKVWPESQEHKEDEKKKMERKNILDKKEKQQIDASRKGSKIVQKHLFKTVEFESFPLCESITGKKRKDEELMNLNEEEKDGVEEGEEDEMNQTLVRFRRSKIYPKREEEADVNNHDVQKDENEDCEKSGKKVRESQRKRKSPIPPDFVQFRDSDVNKNGEVIGMTNTRFKEGNRSQPLKKLKV